jgi:hypothetical protein
MGHYLTKTLRFDRTKLLAAVAMCGLMITTAKAHFVEGNVFCTTSTDCSTVAANGPKGGVLVTATGANGDTFTAVSSFDGSYHIELPEISQHYVVTINAQSLCGNIEFDLDVNVNDGQFPGQNFYVPGVCDNTGNGCPASFWKDKKTMGDATHPTKWVGYKPDDIINKVFINATKQVCSAYGDDGKKHLKDALTWGTATGNVKDAFHNLMREAVAALLNASSPLVNYPATEAEVILMVNDALATCDRGTLISLANDLQAANNVGSPACSNGGTANCTTTGKPNNLTLTYTGGSCASAHNSQPLGQKYNCSESNGGLTGASPVRIIVSSSSSTPTGTSSRFFDGMVAIGDSFDVHGSLGANTYFFIYEGGVLKQFVQMHTSCSAPLIRTETFGGLQLEDYAILP